MPESAELVSARRAGQAANRQLNEIARSRTGKNDAFTAFLQIHACISRHVLAEWPDDLSVIRLNTKFVNRCIEVHDSFYARDFVACGRSWMMILTVNELAKGDTTLLLARMAFTHILEDLPFALLECEVDRESYDSVYFFIVACLDHVGKQRRTPESPSSILELLANDAFPLVRDQAVRLLRHSAWNRYLLLRKGRGAV